MKNSQLRYSNSSSVKTHVVFIYDSGRIPLAKFTYDCRCCDVNAMISNYLRHYGKNPNDWMIYHIGDILGTKQRQVIVVI
jgi:hypothetical protein